MRSMTGFGLGRVQLGEGHLALEIRSLNHRFQEVRVRATSTELGGLTFVVEQLCRQRLGRGRYDVAVRVEGTPFGTPELDVDRARSVYADLCRLRDAVAPGERVPLSLLTTVPDLFAPRAPEAQEDARQALEKAFDLAIGRLDRMRRQEGEALGADLRSRLARVREIHASIQARLPELERAYRDRIADRVRRLVSDSGAAADPHRLEVEVALLAEKSDVEEELVRLDSHFSQFAALVEASEPVGRRMDFLLQEITREANTIGSKCQDAQLAHTVVEMKAEIERMREQVQNVD